MQKLFLTAFKFKTGEETYEEERLVVVNNHDRDTCRGVKTLHIEGVPTDFQFDDRDRAEKKAMTWFTNSHPESTLIYCIAKQAIE